MASSQNRTLAFPALTAVPKKSGITTSSTQENTKSAKPSCLRRAALDDDFKFVAACTCKLAMVDKRPRFPCGKSGRTQVQTRSEPIAMQCCNTNVRGREAENRFENVNAARSSSHPQLKGRGELCRLPSRRTLR